MERRIAQEPVGDYFVGRRMHKLDYKMWGWVRPSGQPWRSAKLVMLNENVKLAPDRAQGTLGSDDGYEYKLIGSFTGDTIYEPSSNGFYPEFLLRDYQLLDPAAPSIYRGGDRNVPSSRVLLQPR